MKEPKYYGTTAQFSRQCSLKQESPAFRHGECQTATTGNDDEIALANTHTLVIFGPQGKYAWIDADIVTEKK